MTSKDAFARHLILERSTFELPLQFRFRRQPFRGTGIFDLEFDYGTGRIRDVRIVQSTGSRLLDRNTVITLRRWRAKPRTIHVMRLPVTFDV